MAVDSNTSIILFIFLLRKTVVTQTTSLHFWTRYAVYQSLNLVSHVLWLMNMLRTLHQFSTIDAKGFSEFGFVCSRFCLSGGSLEGDFGWGRHRAQSLVKCELSQAVGMDLILARPSLAIGACLSRDGITPATTLFYGSFLLTNFLLVLDVTF